MANKFPVSIVSRLSTISILYQTVTSGLNTVYKTVVKTKINAAFDTTDKYAVTGAGEPSYTSAVHK